MKEQLAVGDILIAKSTINFPDGVTKGREYRVSSVWGNSNGVCGFNIINDRRLDAMPVEAVFERKEASE